jgi:hypothetical protein
VLDTIVRTLYILLATESVPITSSLYVLSASKTHNMDCNTASSHGKHAFQKKKLLKFHTLVQVLHTSECEPGIPWTELRNRYTVWHLVRGSRELQWAGIRLVPTASISRRNCWSLEREGGRMFQSHEWKQTKPQIFIKYRLQENCGKK